MEGCLVSSELNCRSAAMVFHVFELELLVSSQVSMALPGIRRERTSRSLHESISR